MKKSRKSKKYPLPFLEAFLAQSPTLNKFNHLNHWSHILALPRPNLSLPIPIGFRETNEIRKRTLLAVWTGLESRHHLKDLDHPSHLFNGLLESLRLTRCRLLPWLLGEDLIDPIDLEVSLLQCRERCLEPIVEGSFGDCQKSPSVSESLYQWRKRIVVMMILMRMRNG